MAPARVGAPHCEITVPTPEVWGSDTQDPAAPAFPRAKDTRVFVRNHDLGRHWKIIVRRACPATLLTKTRAQATWAPNGVHLRIAPPSPDAGPRRKVVDEYDHFGSRLVSSQRQAGLVDGRVLGTRPCRTGLSRLSGHKASQSRPRTRVSGRNPSALPLPSRRRPSELSFNGEYHENLVRQSEQALHWPTVGTPGWTYNRVSINEPPDIIARVSERRLQKKKIAFALRPHRSMTINHIIFNADMHGHMPSTLATPPILWGPGSRLPRISTRPGVSFLRLFRPYSS